MNGEPDQLPSLRRLGERLHEAATREISAERRLRRTLRRRPLLLLGLAGALVFAGGVGAAELFTGSGDPIQGERSPAGGAAQPGVMADAAAPDPAKGALPWALRVFSNAAGEECFQLGRLSGGTLGSVEGGQFRPYEGNPAGPCGDLRRDGLLFSVQQRTQPAQRTIVYGLSGGRGPVTIRIAGRRTRVTPGALGAFVAVYPQVLDIHGTTIKATVDGRRITHSLP